MVHKLQTNSMTVCQQNIFQDFKYRYLNQKQIQWRDTDNAILGLQHRHFWQNGSLTFFCLLLKITMRPKHYIKLALSSLAVHFDSWPIFCPLYERVVKMLPKINIILTFHWHEIKQDNISVTQHKLQYNTGVAMRDKAAQQWWYSTIMAADTFSNTSKFAKMVHPYSFGEYDDENPHYFDLENQWLLVVASDKDSCYKNGEPSTLSFSLSSAYYHYFHSLLTAFTNAPPTKHCLTNSKS